MSFAFTVSPVALTSTIFFFNENKSHNLVHTRPLKVRDHVLSCLNFYPVIGACEPKRYLLSVCSIPQFLSIKNFWAVLHCKHSLSLSKITFSLEFSHFSFPTTIIAGLRDTPSSKYQLKYFI